jgi:iron complex transport system substrate-binding protein
MVTKPRIEIKSIFAETTRYTILFLAITMLLVWVSESSGALFKDDMGREITLKQPPGRIISLAPNVTEILYFLGLGDRIVGVTRFSQYPPEATLKPKIGSYINLNVERIISLSPDLVIGTADGNDPRVVNLLEQADIPVFIVNPRNVIEVLKTIRTLRKVCSLDEKANLLSEQLALRVAIILEKTRIRRKPLIFLQINIKPIMTVNRNTFHHDLIRIAGGRNMTQDEPITYPRISLEEVFRRKPEVILISSMERGGQFERAKREWFKWKSIPAVKNGRVHLIESDLIDRPSPRFIRGLETMARLIHPEVAWE